MPRQTLTTIIACCLYFALPGPALGQLPANPEGVLEFLETTYADGDFSSLQAVLAPDFEFQTPQGHDLERDKYLEMVEKLITKHTLDLHFKRDFRLKSLPEPETWVIRDMSVTLNVDPEGDDYSVTNVITLFLRKNKNGFVQLYRWTEEPAEGS